MQKKQQLIISILTVLIAVNSLAVIGPSKVAAYKPVRQPVQPIEVEAAPSPATNLSYASDETRLTRIKAILNRISTGQAALALLERYEIRVFFEAGHGSRFYKSRNAIVLDSTRGDFSTALSLVHEATHARYFNEGLSGEAAELEREVYIQVKLEEEITAVETQVHATKELSELGVDVSRLHRVLYYPYQQAAGKARRVARYENPALDELTLKDIAQAAGRDAIQQAIATGQYVKSTDQQLYADYWGTIWDASTQS